jgi:predicted GNAT family acetyltransferase
MRESWRVRLSAAILPAMIDEVVGPKPTVQDDAANHRFVIQVDGELVGTAVYHLRGGRYFFVHTEIDLDHEGKGLATTLVQEALDEVRARGALVVPLCPYVAGFVEQHPGYRDLVDWDVLERLDQNRSQP